MAAPRPPKQISPFARACLDALARSDVGRYISLGGAFGLAHYYEYRATRDLDAWWTNEATREDKQQVIAVIEAALAEFGPTRKRAWGDVVSVELQQEGRTVFSFQVAERSALLRDEIAGVWEGGIRVDALEDLLASKMAALVNRGAPRDFLDIYTLCQSQQTSPTMCWRLWQERQRAAGEDDDLERARLAVRANLARIEAARLRDAVDEHSAALRAWFKREFLDGMD